MLHSILRLNNCFKACSGNVDVVLMQHNTITLQKEKVVVEKWEGLKKTPDLSVSAPAS